MFHFVHSVLFRMEVAGRPAIRRDAGRPAPARSIADGPAAVRRPHRTAVRGLRRIMWAWLLAIPSLAQAALTGDEAILRIEQVERFYARMPELAQIDRPVLEVNERVPRSEVRARGMALAKTTYPADRAMAEIRSALRTAGPETPADRLPGIAARMDAVRARIDSRSFEEMQELGKQWETRYRARPDRRRIDAVAAAMAAPELAAETAVTARRMKWLYETLLLESPERLRAVSDAEFEAGLREIMARSRARDDAHQPPPMRLDVSRQFWRMRERMVLAQLAPEDVAALDRFYARPAGRSKIAALKAAFRSRNDADGRALMTRMLGDVRAGKP